MSTTDTMDTTDPEVVHLLEEIADGGGGTSTGETWDRVTKTSDYTASDMESIWADSSSQQVTITLPPPSQNVQIRVLAIDTANGVILSENSVEGINDQGGSHSTINMREGESIRVESNGATWWII
jgi:hypothetical protein